MKVIVGGIIEKEAKEYFNGNVYVPNDLDEIEL